jgi:AraC family transcriptional regulator
MKTSPSHSIECASLPIFSSQNQGWDNILIEQFQHPAGEGNLHYRDEHVICLSLAPRPVRLLQIQDGKTYSGLYGKGDFCIIPAEVPFFARWESDDRFLQIRIPSRFITQVALEDLAMNPNQLEMVPEFRSRDAQLEAIAMLLLSEMKQENLGGRLYIESLVNVLSVHLLRKYAVAKPHLPTYEGGLPQHQLRQVLDYINDYLDRDIKLIDLAALLDISQFHFSYLFKQSIGISPYQYLLQQRVERAKQLLKQTELSIMDIALSCGFSSHSHLSKQFRQFTGTTPRMYRGK